MYQELRTSEDRPGSKELLEAFEHGWLTRLSDPSAVKMPWMVPLIDPGEAASIRLAAQFKVSLLIDERRGRAVARRSGVKIIGTGGILIVAKRQGIISTVDPILSRLRETGYRLSDRLCRKIRLLADE